jgi:hypothetical protein
LRRSAEKFFVIAAKDFQEISHLKEIALSLQLLGIIACKYERQKEALDLMALGAVIMAQIGHVDLQRTQHNLTEMLAAQRSTEEERDELLKQKASEAYQRETVAESGLRTRCRA